jgi:Ca2+-binding EF-hand superfamily protein
MKRSLKIALFSAAFVLIAATPDAFAQQRRGRRGGGGRRAGAGLFKRKKKQPAAAPTVPIVRGPAPAPGRSGKAPGPAKPTAPLAADEKRFRDLIDEIDEAISRAEAEQAKATEDGAARAIKLPADVEPHSAQWREMQRPIFETCDYDGSGWISFRELQSSLDADREEFGLYDRDRDGRIGPREFMSRYDEIVGRTGAFRLPRAEVAEHFVAPRSSEQLLAAFDRDADGALDAEETAAVLADYGRSDVDPSVVLASVDSDGDARLKGPELFGFSRLMSMSIGAAPMDADGKKKQPGSVEALFGAIEPRSSPAANRSDAPWIPGPVPHFRRLDLDRDGFVTIAELVDLQAGSATSASIGAVLAALDLDEDGRISEREFLTSLSTARK